MPRVSNVVSGLAPNELLKACNLHRQFSATRTKGEREEDTNRSIHPASKTLLSRKSRASTQLPHPEWKDSNDLHKVNQATLPKVNQGTYIRHWDVSLEQMRHHHDQKNLSMGKHFETRESEPSERTPPPRPRIPK
ncbi:hypothetical protein YC2023_050563 [Brassica napus]